MKVWVLLRKLMMDRKQKAWSNLPLNVSKGFLLVFNHTEKLNASVSSCYNEPLPMLKIKGLCSELETCLRVPTYLPLLSNLAAWKKM